MVSGRPQNEMNPYDSEEYQDIHASQWNTSSGGHGGGSLGLDAIAGHPSGYYVAEGRSWSNDGTHSTSRSWYYSVDGSDSDSSLVMPHLPISHEDDRIRRSYFNGQVADVMKRSIWWSVVGVLISELTQLYHTIPLSRIVFNASLICGSLFSDFVAETATMRRLLCSTVLYRMIFWLLLLPACYFFFGTYLHSTALLTSTLMFIVALDGITEALANTSDALYKGVDRLSDQYNMVITPEAHGRMNREYQIVSTWSFVLLVAPLAVLAYGVKRLTNKSDLLVFALVMGGAFLLLSAVSLWCYLRGMPESIHSDQFMQRGGLDISYTTACDEMYSKVADIAEGLLVARSPGYLMRHVIFLAVETAFEHVILSFLIPMIALNQWVNSDHSLLHSNMICALLVAAGKLGGAIYGTYVSYSTTADAVDVAGNRRRSTKIHVCLLLSLVSLLLLPLSVFSQVVSPSKTYTRLTFMGLAIFSFFAFSSYPKAVLSSSVNTAIMNHPLSYKIFDFVGICVLLTDLLLTSAVTVFVDRFFGGIEMYHLSLTVVFFYTWHTVYHILIGEFGHGRVSPAPGIGARGVTV